MIMLVADQFFHAVLNEAIELNLFEIIGKGGSKSMSPSEIASKLPNPYEDMACRLDRVLFLLSNYSLLTCSFRKTDEHGRIERLYALSPTGKYLIPDEDGFSFVNSFKLFSHPAYRKLW